MKLYVCYGTFRRAPRPGGHPCGNAHHALKEAGWDPQVVRTYGAGPMPDFLNPTRAKVRELTGNNWVPVLETDNGEVIQGSDRIIAWAGNNPAAGAEQARQPR
jgi:hypothetical protein